MPLNMAVVRNFSSTCSRLFFQHNRYFSSQCLTLETLSPSVKQMEYAIRGKVLLEAQDIEKELQQGNTRYPFNEIIYANIGDCQAMGQKPLTFVRQLLSCCIDTSHLSSDRYPSDVRERAHSILSETGGYSLGSYTDSRGISLIRKHTEEFITKRDGIPADCEDIYLINGATEGIRSTIVLCLTEKEKTGIMIPVPQYPLYSATISEMNAYPIKYYLDEENGWNIRIEEMYDSLNRASEHCKPKIMVVINPGNPTGQYLSEENLRDIIKFCHSNSMLLLADEVYQENTYVDNVKFSSFRKILLGMGEKYKDFQLVSFNSTSKGYIGECGIRGGYMEMIGFSPEVMEQVYKLFSTHLCANSAGQVVVDVMVNPPRPGDPSYNQFEEEKHNILESLKIRAKMAYDRFNSIPGVKCNEVQGSMYAFPRIDIPDKALDDAKREDPNMALDTYYCLELLRQQGICFVPGSGFGQIPGTWHFRTTILPSIQKFDEVLTKFEIFHTNFLKKYKI